MSNDYVKVQRRPLFELLTCPLCPNLYREATTICVCLHTFCKRCIYQKLEEDKKNQCPVCNAYLGSFPEELLRNDHNLRELVMQICPLEATSEEEKLAASPVKTRVAETITPSIIETNPQHQDFSTSREAKMIHDDYFFPGNNLHLIQTPYKILNQSINAIKKQVNALVKRKRRTKRKPSQFLTGQREDGSMIGTEKEMSNPGPSVLERSIDSANPCGETVSRKELSAYSTRPVWFCLLACQEKKSMALPQIPKPFISTKNGDFAVSIVTKYLARKLNLKHESEVEIMCFGHPLVPTLTLNNLTDIWLEAISYLGPVLVNCNAENGDGRNFVMELTYKRSKKQGALQ